jgi:hypothetical protein
VSTSYNYFFFLPFFLAFFFAMAGSSRGLGTTAHARTAHRCARDPHTGDGSDAMNSGKGKLPKRKNETLQLALN